MPVPWLTVLQNVPWSDVIKNAPKVADGARKLWQSVGKKPQAAAAAPANTTAAGTSNASALTGLESRARALESAIADLQAQMLASSELIKALAEQNTQLIERLESNRRRWGWLAIGVGAAAVTALAALTVAWIGRANV
jgi:TolA-binding protein